MPYATPTSSPTSTLSSATASPSTSPRPGHRRTRSSFSDERGPGAFAPLGALPRRKPSSKKAVFHLNVDDDLPPEHDNSTDPQSIQPPHPTPLPSPLTSLQLSRDAGRFSPSIAPPTHIDLPPRTDPSASIPFPTQSPLPSPSLQPPQRGPFASSGTYSSSASSSSLPRTPSSPIILSNGKPLKSSLKGSSSTPSIAGDFHRHTKHLRAQSAPSTPNIHKNVHFAGEGDDDESLVSVRLYNRSGKPASINKPAGEETETETEAENGPSSGASSYPFPSFGGPSMSSSSQPILHEIDPSTTSPVPHPNPFPSSNVFLENISLPRTRPPTLRGTVLVRNVAFEKHVAVRFTLDNWQTTSEVLCRHVVSLPGLPPSFLKEKSVDIATKIVNGILDQPQDSSIPTWDRFSFTIRLEDYEHRLTDRTLELVARYSVPGSDAWWDNNQGKNYCVRFRRAAASPLATPTQNILPTSPVVPNIDPIAGSLGVRKGMSAVPARLMGADAKGLAQQRTFSAPSSLRFTPATSTLADIPMVSTPPPSVTAAKAAPAIVIPATAEAAFPLVRSHSSPYPPSSPSLSPSPEASKKGVVPSPTSPIVAEKAGNYIRRRLSLSNYVAPGSASTSPTTLTKPLAKAEVEKTGNKTVPGDGSLVTPPSTPPNQIANLPSPTRMERPTRIDIPASASTTTTTMIGGMPATILRQWSTSNIPSENETPFSPTSTTAPEFGNFGTISASAAGLISPPRSRENSEDGGSGEAGRGSPEGASTPSVQAQSQTVNVVLPSLDLMLAQANELPTPGEQDVEDGDEDEEGDREQLVYPGSSAMGTMGGMSDSSYEAFIRQWCFAQSAPPTPGVHAHSTPSGSPADSATPTLSPGSTRPAKAATWGRSGSPSAVDRNTAAYNDRNLWEAIGGSASGGGIEGRGGGYGFPGFTFGAVGARGMNTDVGMVGGEC